VRECARELLYDVWDLPALLGLLREIQSGQMAVREVRTGTPSPLSLPLRRQVEAGMMYDYHPVSEAVQHQAADALEALRQNVTPPKSLLEQAAQLRPPADEQQLHTLLMTSGDLVAGEAQIPYEWLDSLLRKGQSLYIEPGLWIACEEESLYNAALDQRQPEALQKLIRRLLRYRGGQTLESICARYALSEESIAPSLEALVEEGVAVLHGEEYFHAQNVRRAQQAHLRAQRSDIQTQPGSHYAAYLAGRVLRSAPAAAQLEHALDALADAPYPLPLWENVILPARVSGYHAGMLDALLAQGAFYWKLAACGGSPSLRFSRREDLDYTGEWPDAEGLSQAEAEILKALRRQGASFAHALPLLGSSGQTAALLSLARRGLVTADAYAPVRYLLDEKAIENQHAKRRTMARVNVKLAGRWEALRPCKELPLQRQVDAAFARFTLLSRETAREANLPWPQALALLRLMEYQGRARRGYFVRELGGAQYVKAEDFTAFTAAMAAPEEALIWLNAADPLQIIGKCLPGQNFACLASSAVCLCKGEILVILERSGAAVRVLDFTRLSPCMRAFAQAFQAKQVYARQRRIVVREYPTDAAQAFLEAGFRRELGEYVLERR
jgi:ATP-dependent Lhr-like helicase